MGNNCDGCYYTQVPTGATMCGECVRAYDEPDERHRDYYTYYEGALMDFYFYDVKVGFGSGTIFTKILLGKTKPTRIIKAKNVNEAVKIYQEKYGGGEFTFTGEDYAEYGYEVADRGSWTILCLADYLIKN